MVMAATVLVGTARAAMPAAMTATIAAGKAGVTAPGKAAATARSPGVLAAATPIPVRAGVILDPKRQKTPIGAIATQTLPRPAPLTQQHNPALRKVVAETCPQPPSKDPQPSNRASPMPMPRPVGRAWQDRRQGWGELGKREQRELGNI